MVNYNGATLEHALNSTFAALADPTRRAILERLAQGESSVTALAQPFNVSLLTDQQLGGMLLWVPGDMMSILAAGVVMIMWYEKEEG